MAFPKVATTNTSSQGSNTETHIVNLPTGVASGNLLIVFFTVDGTGSTLGWPAGWTALLAEGGSGMVTSARYRIADGTEGTTITVTTTGDTEQSAHTSYRITDWHGTTPPESGGIATGTGAAPDPGSLNPAASGWDAEDTLWIAYAGSNGVSAGSPRFSAYPSSYTNGIESISSGGNGCVQGTAQRELNASAEDAGSFTVSADATDWRAATVAVRPAAAAAANPPRLTVMSNAVHRSFNW